MEGGGQAEVSAQPASAAAVQDTPTTIQEQQQQQQQQQQGEEKQETPSVKQLDSSVSIGRKRGMEQDEKEAKKQHTVIEKEVPLNSLKGSFVKDLIPMMIGFGDDESPCVETVDFVEDAVVAYSVYVLTCALNLARQRGRIKASTGKPMGPPTAEDVMTVVRKDSRKVRRVEELLIMQKEIKIIQDMEKTDEEALAQQFS